MCHSIPAQESLFLEVVALITGRVLFAPVVVPCVTFVRLLICAVVGGLGTPATFERRAVFASSLVLAKLAVALSLEVRVKLVFDGAVGPLDLEEH